MCQKSHLYRNIRSLLKMQFVKIKHIKIGRYVGQFFGSNEHSTKCIYEVLTRDHQYETIKVRILTMCELEKIMPSEVHLMVIK